MVSDFEMNQLCIFDPASEAEGGGLLVCELSEEHPLHSPKYLQIQMQMQIQMQILKSRCGHPPPLHLKVNCKDGPTGRHCGEEVEGDQQEEGGEGHQGKRGKQGEPTVEHSMLKFQPNLALKVSYIRRTILAVAFKNSS